MVQSTYKTENNATMLIIKQGDIVDVNFGKSIGSEQGGVRPAIIIQNDIGNKYSPTTIVVPLTTQTKKTIPTHKYLKATQNNGLTEDSVILAEQIRVVDKSRIVSKRGRVGGNYAMDIVFTAIGRELYEYTNNTIYQN